ncbi:hypothetical protein SDC9_52242 [bioreactor metagenome]|uniref:ATPase AAA-type core domain-containing protein n=1 Tax=bioreactor metagenome TaxID=1076179 RepID=A0A644WQL5_9ZZZZ
MFLEKAIFINRAPFDHIELDFKDKGINVLSAINGKGKTTILSHIVDAWHEMAKNHYFDSFKGKENKFYRVSSSIYNIDSNRYSLVYLRFNNNSVYNDYIEIRGNINESEYNNIIKLEDKIQYPLFSKSLQEDGFIKLLSKIFNRASVIQHFNNNVLTYFPAYRHEKPGYLTKDYEVKLDYSLNLRLISELLNPIEVVTGLPQIANWMMDVILDTFVYSGNAENIVLRSKINQIFTLLMSSKTDGEIRIGIGDRGYGATRIQIVDNKSNMSIYPSIFNLSSGESSILALFMEILRQGDNINKLSATDVNGIVLIDEVDKHLHIKLQKEVLPKLFNLFPNIQFIVSSHSPFMNIGLAEEAQGRTQIIDLDNQGIVCEPKNNEMYKEVYNMMIDENNRFAEKYRELKGKINEGTKPYIITEGKTDIKHILKAKEILEIADMDFDYHEINEDWGDSKLKALLTNLSKVNQNRKIIGIFDRDVEEYLKFVEDNTNQYKNLGNNVFAFAIPLVNEDLYGDKISIEHYYKKEHLLKKDSNNRRLFLGEEFYKSGKSKDGKFNTKVDGIQHKVEINGIIDKKVYEALDLEEEKSIALTKNDYAELVFKNKEFISDFDFSNFNSIFDKIKKII